MLSHVVHRALRSLLMLALVGGIATELRSEATGFQRCEYVDAEGSHGYYVYIPENYDPSREWPVMLFLHGAGERGHDPDKVISLGMGPVIRNWGEPFPFLVVFPQCEDIEGRVIGGWLAGSPDAERALKIFDHVQEQYHTDPDCCVLCGWSMGGFGAWSLANAYPSRWTAVAPLSGGGDPAKVANLRGMHIWAVHGERDLIVRLEGSQHMCDAAVEAGAIVHHTVLDDCAHDAWLRLVGNKTFVEWLLDPESVDPADSVWPEKDPEIELDLPFHTAIVAPRAVSIRVGNDALRLIGHGAPQAIDSELLTGTLPDVEQTFTALDEEFQAKLIGLSFQAEVGQAFIEGVGVDRLRARVGLAPLTITIDRIEVAGGDIRADAGTTQIVVGHRYPAWLDIELRPEIVNGRMRFEALASAFEFTQENWYVSTPETINIQGTELSERDAKSALVGGLYRQQETIRGEVLKAIPDLLDSLEEAVDAALQDDYLVTVWPLPVYQPRVRLGIDSIWVDDAGISAVLNVEVAATDWELAPSVPMHWHSLGSEAMQIERRSGVEIRVAAGVMEALSEGMRETGVSHIHVLDIGNQEFAGFTDPIEMEAAVPGIATEANQHALASRIEMSAPFGIDSQATEREIERGGNEGRLPLILHAPHIRMPVGIEGSSEEIAEFDVSFSQRMDLELQERAFRPPLLQVYWSPDVEVDVTGRRLDSGPLAATSAGAPTFSTSDNRVNADAFARQFASSWSSWMTSEPSPPAEVYDLAVGQTGLRCQSIDWDQQSLVVRYAVPTTRLTNIGTETLVIRTRGPADPAWGERRSIPAGESILVETEPPLWVVATNEIGSEPVLLTVGSDHLLRQTGRRLDVSQPEAD